MKLEQRRKKMKLEQRMKKICNACIADFFASDGIAAAEVCGDRLAPRDIFRILRLQAACCRHCHTGEVWRDWMDQ